MKTAAAIARFVLGLVFVVFGLNGFLNFMPMGPVPALAGQFGGALIQSHYMAVVLALEIVSGLFLLTNSYALLATTFVAPIIVNILLFHIFHGASGPSDRGDCRRALGCERLPVSSAVVATLPATIRRRRTSGVTRVAAELHRAVSVAQNARGEFSPTAS
jgi:putative oxidoreductase